MAFLFVGILLLSLKLAEFGPVAHWPWWGVLLPFGMAIAWWAFADSTGLTQRRAMDKMEAKKADRRQRNLESLGLGPRRDRKARHAGKRDGIDPIANAVSNDPTQR